MMPPNIGRKASSSSGGAASIMRSRRRLGSCGMACPPRRDPIDTPAASQSERIGLLRPPRLLFLASGQRRHGARFVEPDPRVELVGQDGFGIMAPALGLRTV